MNDWADRAAGLAEELVTAGKLRSPEWIAAVRAVPRHELVPVVYEQDPGTGAWLTRDATDPAWWELVYANRGLFTKIGEAAGSWGTGVVGLSSSSTPGLMTRMLEALDVRKGHDVLEIGTGTVCNAALLCHRLGSEHVCSVDSDPELVELARDRLVRIGYRPMLVVTDGSWRTSNSPSTPAISSGSGGSPTAPKDASNAPGPGSWRCARPPRGKSLASK